MKIINLLIIDDSPNEVPIKNMCNELSLVGYQVRPFWINPQAKMYRKDSDDERESLEMDKPKFEKDVKKCLRTNEIHITACDYGLGDGLTGLIVLAQIRHEFHFRGISILFSGDINHILHKIFNAENQDLTYQKNMLKKLVLSHSIEFPERDDLAQTLKGIIKNIKLGDINRRDEILRWLHAFKDHSFNGHPDLERKTCGEIAKAIEEVTPLGIQFQKLLIEQGMATLIKLHKIPINE